MAKLEKQHKCVEYEFMDVNYNGDEDGIDIYYEYNQGYHNEKFQDTLTISEIRKLLEGKYTIEEIVFKNISDALALKDLVCIDRKTPNYLEGRPFNYVVMSNYKQGDPNDIQTL